MSERDLKSLVGRNHLRPSRNPNVVLRVVPWFSDAWPLSRLAPVSAIALDLLDDPDPRSNEVGARLLATSGR